MGKMAKDGLAEANQTMQQFQATQGLTQTLATDGVDGQATIRSMVATGKQINLQLAWSRAAYGYPHRGRREIPIERGRSMSFAALASPTYRDLTTETGAS